ncbi:hypothetical protein Bbelb_249700 [Branchiostoma belcheri]|nr:hypothetical protein Bbelb_249700 [Branchiostoma belcheri]
MTATYPQHLVLQLAILRERHLATLVMTTSNHMLPGRSLWQVIAAVLTVGTGVALIVGGIFAMKSSLGGSRMSATMETVSATGFPGCSTAVTTMTDEKFSVSPTLPANPENLQGVCVDASGRIIVANKDNNRVDMFTTWGRFVRTIADIKGPFGIALGPDGDLVVTSPWNNSVSIVPRHMVLP